MTEKNKKLIGIIKYIDKIAHRIDEKNGRLWWFKLINMKYYPLRALYTEEVDNIYKEIEDEESAKIKLETSMQDIKTNSNMDDNAWNELVQRAINNVLNKRLLSGEELTRLASLKNATFAMCNSSIVNNTPRLTTKYTNSSEILYQSIINSIAKFKTITGIDPTHIYISSDNLDLLKSKMSYSVSIDMFSVEQTLNGMRVMQTTDNTIIKIASNSDFIEIKV